MGRWEFFKAVLSYTGWWLMRPQCLWFGHDLDHPGIVKSERIQKIRCRTCNSWLAYHVGGIPGIADGALVRWDEDFEEMYR